jgi:hypothetical protein
VTALPLQATDASIANKHLLVLLVNNNKITILQHTQPHKPQTHVFAYICVKKRKNINITIHIHKNGKKNKTQGTTNKKQKKH